MITTGQSITNSVTGETLVFRTTSADTNGECVVVETYVEPNGAVAAAHVHPSQEETFEVIAGELEFRLAHATGGRLTNLKGGLPIVVDGITIGGIGVGSQTGEEDLEVAKAGVAALAGAATFE